MTKSMTGYGRSQQLISGYDITVEVKAVNHRYFEFSARVPRSYGYLEEKLKGFIHESVSRGKLDVYVSITPVETSDTIVEINLPLAKSYLDELRTMAKELNIKDNLELSHISKFNDIYTLRRKNDDEELIWELVKQVADSATEKFNNMRLVEGEKLKEDVVSRLDTIEMFVNEIENKSSVIVESWRERLYNKISQVLEDKQIDEGRLLTEVAIFAEKVAVDEETVRLKSHLIQFRNILDEVESVGRKLDFMVQEVNREINTIGSKCQDVESAKIVVEVKSEIEKIREQIQNIE